MMQSMTESTDTNLLEFPIQDTEWDDSTSDFQIISQTKLTLTRALNMIANGNKSRLTSKLIGNIEKVNAIFIKNGYPPIDVDTEVLKEKLKQWQSYP